MILSALLAVISAQAAPANKSYVYPPWGHTWGVVKATPFKLRLFVGNKTKFNDPQGIACTRLDSWDDTTRTDDDDEITAYGINSGDNCVIYNRSMYALGVYGLDEGHVKMKTPWGIAAENSGKVYVTDRGNSRLLRFQNPGKDLIFVSTIGSAGDEPGEFVDPRGVALAPDGRVFVTDAALGRVTVFDAMDRVIEVWHGFEGPDGIAVVGTGERWSYHTGEAFAVVVDSMNQRVRKLSLDGKLLAETNAASWGRAGGYLSYIALDYYNQILIADRDRGCIHKLDRNLNWLTSFGEPGDGDYQFDQPRGIAIYRKFGQILIAERQGAQYLWVATDASELAASVRADSIWRDLQVNFRLTEPSLVDMDIVDIRGRFITRIMQGRYYPAGGSQMVWAMTLPQQLPGGGVYPALPVGFKPGALLPAGEYVLNMRFRATYSSREHFTAERAANVVLKR